MININIEAEREGTGIFSSTRISMAAYKTTLIFWHFSCYHHHMRCVNANQKANHTPQEGGRNQSEIKISKNYQVCLSISQL